MKKIIYLFVALTALLQVSCEKDPQDDLEDGGWNNERSILSIKFENQVGNAQVTRADDVTGEVDISINVTDLPDLSHIVLQELVLSYGARANLNAGEAINFENADHSASLIVTSPTGKQRTYRVVAASFEETLIGTYNVDNLILYGGTGPEYGGGAVLALTDKPWIWPENAGPAAELDNTLTFTLEGISPEGNTFGTVINDAGADGLYADFLFIGSPQTDVNNFYRQIPQGTAKWTRNYANNTITFTFADGSVKTGSFIGPGTQDLGNNLSKTTANNAFVFDLNGTDDWDAIYSDYDKFVKKPRRYWIDITKQ
jgi:hypothetical protein